MGNDRVERDQLFERLWIGDAAMEEWTAAVSGGSGTSITDRVIAIHTGYLFGNASAVRTNEGLVLVDSGSRETASQTLAALGRWDDSPVHTVIYTHGYFISVKQRRSRPHERTRFLAEVVKRGGAAKP